MRLGTHDAADVCCVVSASLSVRCERPARDESATGIFFQRLLHHTATLTRKHGGRYGKPCEGAGRWQEEAEKHAQEEQASVRGKGRRGGGRGGVTRRDFACDGSRKPRDTVRGSVRKYIFC